MGRILAGLWAVVGRICDFLLRRNTEATQQLTAAKHPRKRAGSNLVLNRSRSYLEPMLLECCNVNTFQLLQLRGGIPDIFELEIWNLIEVGIWTAFEDLLKFGFVATK